MCSFVIKVKGKDVELLLEDVCSLEESDDKVRVLNRPKQCGFVSS